MENIEHDNFIFKKVTLLLLFCVTLSTKMQATTRTEELVKRRNSFVSNKFCIANYTSTHNTAN